MEDVQGVTWEALNTSILPAAKRETVPSLCFHSQKDRLALRMARYEGRHQHPAQCPARRWFTRSVPSRRRAASLDLAGSFFMRDREVEVPSMVSRRR